MTPLFLNPIPWTRVTGKEDWAGRYDVTSDENQARASRCVGAPAQVESEITVVRWGLLNGVVPRLTSVACNHTTCRSMKKRLLAISTILFAIWFFYRAYRGFSDIESGESLISVDWLPVGATNVSFYRSYLNTAYEFDISEQGFRDWSRWELQEIGEPVGISRYLVFSTPRPQEPASPTSAEIEALALEYSKRSVTIRDGLYYGYLQDNGGGIWVGYDRESGRAYYQSAPR